MNPTPPPIPSTLKTALLLRLRFGLFSSGIAEM